MWFRYQLPSKHSRCNRTMNGLARTKAPLQTVLLSTLSLSGSFSVPGKRVSLNIEVHAMRCVVVVVMILSSWKSSFQEGSKGAYSTSRFSTAECPVLRRSLTGRFVVARQLAKEHKYSNKSHRGDIQVHTSVDVKAIL